MSRKNKTRRFFVAILAFYLLFGHLDTAQASTIHGQKARVTVESFKISGDAIVPGEEFELTLVVKNNSNTDPVRSIIMSFTSDSEGVYTVYGQPDQVYIPELQPGATYKVKLSLKAADKIKDSVVKFTTEFTYEDYISSENSNKTSVQLPVTTSSKFEIQNVSFPEEVYQGQKTRMRVTYKNSGGDDFYNIIMMVSTEGEVDDEQYSLGSLIAGKVSYAETYVTLDNIGEQNVIVTFSYEDIEGNKFATNQYEQKINVLQNQEEEEQSDEQNVTFSKSYDLYFLIVAVIAMAVVVFNLYRKYEK